MTQFASTSATRPLFLAAGILAIEAVAAIIFGVVEATRINGSRPMVGAGVAFLMIGYGVVLLLVARGLVKVRRWSRGPAVATQLLHLPIAWSFVNGPTWWVALLLALLSLTALICLILPSSTAALIRPEPADSTPDQQAPDQQTPDQ